MNYNWTILAQADSGITSESVTNEENAITKVPADPNAPMTTKQPPKSPLLQYLPLILIFVLMYFMLFRGPRKKQQQHKQMVQSLKKNDKVRTIGGIIGTVVDVKDDEITLKIDESNNTKIKVLPSAIGKNISKDNA